MIGALEIGLPCQEGSHMIDSEWYSFPLESAFPRGLPSQGSKTAYRFPELNISP